MMNIFEDPQDQTFIKAPFSLKLIYALRYIINTQNLFLKWEKRLLRRVHERYSTLPDEGVYELEKISRDAFSLEEFEAAGNNIRPFVIKNFFNPEGLDWGMLKTRFGDSMVPTHPNSEISDDFIYERPDYTKLRDTIESMEKNDPTYVIGSSQVFHDHPELSEMFAPSFVADDFGKKLIRREMFIGGPKVGSAFHCAGGDNFFLMVSGRKQWLFVSPRNYLAMYPTFGRDRESYVHTSEIISQTYDEQQADRFPLFAKARKYSVTLEPGDLLFNPSMWWHEVRNLDRTIGIPHRTLSEGRRRYELPSWLNVAKMGAVKYVASAFTGLFTGKPAQVDTSDEMIINTYGGSRKAKTE